MHFTLVQIVDLDVLGLHGLEIAEDQLVGLRVEAEQVGHVESHGVDLPVFINHYEFLVLVVEGTEHGDVVKDVLQGDVEFQVLVGDEHVAVLVQTINPLVFVNDLAFARVFVLVHELLVLVRVHCRHQTI